VFAAIIDSMRPAILQAKTESEECFRQSARKLYSVIIYLSLAQSALMTLLAKPIISILYGSSYQSAISTLRLVVWYTTFSYVGSVRNIWILSQGLQRYMWKINLSGAILNVILNAVLIPVWGINGAALASLATQIFTNVVTGYIVKPIRENNKIMVEAIQLKNVI
jgi:O-antigen/teichoic acid export membrane protein